MIKKTLCLLLIVFIASACQTQNYTQTQTGPAGDRGYFAAEDLPRVLAQAAEMMEKGASSGLRPLFSRVSYEQGGALVTFAPPVYPQGVSFSLPVLGQGNTGNTLQLSFPLRPQMHGIMAMLCVVMVVEASQPDSFRRNGEQFEDLLHTGGTIEIDGWTYNCVINYEENKFIFSSTAP
ncbi:MAG: hypothetical protein LBJ14_00655 [Desulfarculales bacterium]|jgi:hypothetical protein|nr:hypothetical protein [Desulfarculales bacterium]